MNFKDYKFWFIRRDNDGFIIEAAVRFYEGKYKDKVYIRTKKLDTKIYTDKDFGLIKTDDELRKFLNQQLAKIKGREAIPEQKWQA